MKNVPTEPGVYYAAKDYSSAWNYVVNIKGKVPFLSYDLWSLEHPDRGFNEDNSLFSFSSNQPVFLFGNRIDFGFHYSEKVKINNPGLYEVFSNKTRKLACLTGIYPYFSCWVWDIDTNNKSKYRAPWNLSFVRYIKKPIEVH